jgi:alcohol dehydrogenase
MSVGIPPFTIARLPEIRFGPGRIAELPMILAGLGPRVLLVTGARSFVSTPGWSRLIEELERLEVAWRHVIIDDEPSPQLIDGRVEEQLEWDATAVCGIGGGSVLDGAKALAGLLGSGTRVLDHLEGVGRGIPYTGPALPFIAVPTTAGTGSEATRNAVLSVRGEQGYKKSFRDNQLVAQIALVDSNLLETCPRPLMRAQGMDAFTQLFESLVSSRSNPFTEALAWSGLESFRDGFFSALEGDAEGYGCIAYAALLSGICLAQTGLGSVHGLASPLGAFFPIPHGVVCGTLVAEATAINVQALRQRLPESPALARYARLGKMFGVEGSTESELADGLVGLLRQWTVRLELERLSAYGVTEAHFPRIVADSRGSSMQTNPVVLTDEEITEILRRRL